MIGISRRELLLAQAPGQFQAAGAGQHPVEQDQVRHLFGDRHCAARASAACIGVHAGLAQGKGDHVANRGFVFDDQDAFVHALDCQWLMTGILQRMNVTCR